MRTAISFHMGNESGIFVIAQILQRALHTDVRQSHMSPQTTAISDRTRPEVACDDCKRLKAAR
jgi:hypothetical protein